jgi:hypothetical protein
LNELLLLLDTKQLIDFLSVKTNNDLSSNVNHRHALLSRAADHIAGGSRIAAYVNVFEFDAFSRK